MGGKVSRCRSTRARLCTEEADCALERDTRANTLLNATEASFHASIRKEEPHQRLFEKMSRDNARVNSSRDH